MRDPWMPPAMPDWHPQWNAETVRRILSVRDDFMQAARRAKFGPGPVLGNYGWYVSRARIFNRVALHVRAAILDPDRAS